MNELDFAALRNGMVDRHVAARGVRSHVVLDAMRTVPREDFVAGQGDRDLRRKVRRNGYRRARFGMQDTRRPSGRRSRDFPLLGFHCPESKAIVWAHNSHVGDSAATEMSSRGEYNIGQLCREEFGDAAYSIGFGTNSGFVAAASEWDGSMEIKAVRPALPGSYERLCHEAGHPQFLLPLRNPLSTDAVDGLLRPRLERAIGEIYRPKTELESHYFQAVLPRQFDEYVWFDETAAVTPLKTGKLEGFPDTYPFGL